MAEASYIGVAYLAPGPAQWWGPRGSGEGREPYTQATTMAGSSTLAELDDPPSPDGCQGGNDGTQGNDPSGVPLSEPPSGGYAKLATAAATALPLPPPLPCQVSRGLQGRDPERQGPASPAAATGRPPPYTAINVGLSVNQRFELSIELSTSQPLYPYMAQMDQVDQILEPPVSTARHTGTPAAQMQAAYSLAAQPPTSARGAEEASSTLTISTVVQRPASLREEERRL